MEIDHSDITLDLISLLEYLDSPDKLSQIHPLCASLNSRLVEIVEQVKLLPGIAEYSPDLKDLKSLVEHRRKEVERLTDAIDKFTKEHDNIVSGYKDPSDHVGSEE